MTAEGPPVVGVPILMLRQTAEARLTIEIQRGQAAAVVPAIGREPSDDREAASVDRDEAARDRYISFVDDLGEHSA